MLVCLSQLHKVDKRITALYNYLFRLKRLRVTAFPLEFPSAYANRNTLFTSLIFVPRFSFSLIKKLYMLTAEKWPGKDAPCLATGQMEESNYYIAFPGHAYCSEFAASPSSLVTSGGTGFESVRRQ